MPVLPVRRLARGTSVGLGAVALVAASAMVPLGAVAAETGDEVTLMAFNDFHGALGGAGALACQVETVRSDVDTSFLFSAGDSVGGSAFESAVQNDEPTLDVLNALEVDASALGNHEYDQGYRDIIDRIEENTDFPYLAANVTYTDTGERAHDAYTVVERDDVKVAVIGAVTTKVYGKVSPKAIEGLTISDPVDAVNQVVTELEDKGVEYDVLVAAYHEGASESADPGAAPSNSDPAFEAIVNETSPEVDAILNGDSHRVYAFNAPVPGQDGEVRPVVQTGSSAANLGVITLALGEDGDWDVVGIPEMRPTDADCTTETTITTAVNDIADKAIADAAVIGAEPVGSVSQDLTTSWDDSKAAYVDGVRTATIPTGQQATTKGDNRARHSAAGDMLADSMKWYLEDSGKAGEHEVIGFMNPGGIRAELWYEEAAGEGDGVVTYAEANSMVPFGNTLNSGEVSGWQFKQMLEEQWQRAADGSAVDPGDRQFLAFSVSDNVEYVFDSTLPLDERILDIRIDGEPIDLDATYTIVTASFLFEGGDNMWALSEAQDVRDSGVLDRDAFIDYLDAHPGLEPDYAQRQIELQLAEYGEYDSETGVDIDPVLRVGNIESQSLGAPEIETVSIDAGEYGTFDAPYVWNEELARYTADIALTDWLCVPEGTWVPLTITAIPEVGTEIVIEMPAFEWEFGGAPDTCFPDSGGDGEGDGGEGDGDGDGGEATPPAEEEGGGTTPPVEEDGDGTTPPVDEEDDVDPVTTAPVGNDTEAGADTEDLARTGVSVSPMLAAAGLLSLAGAGAIGLRHRLTRR